MKWNEFFKQKFGIDGNEEMDAEGANNPSPTAPSGPSVPANNTNNDNTSPASGANEGSSTVEQLQATISQLQASLAQLKNDNAKLVEGKNITNPSTKSAEEIIYDMFKEDKVHGNESNNIGNTSGM